MRDDVRHICIVKVLVSFIEVKTRVNTVGDRANETCTNVREEVKRSSFLTIGRDVDATGKPAAINFGTNARTELLFRNLIVIEQALSIKAAAKRIKRELLCNHSRLDSTPVVSFFFLFFFSDPCFSLLKKLTVTYATIFSTKSRGPIFSRYTRDFSLRHLSDLVTLLVSLH